MRPLLGLFCTASHCLPTEVPAKQHRPAAAGGSMKDRVIRRCSPAAWFAATVRAALAAAVVAGCSKAPTNVASPLGGGNGLAPFFSHRLSPNALPGSYIVI